jgi:hypothetical protein
MLDEIIWSLMDDRQASACLTGQMMGHVPRYNAIIALLTYKKMPSELAKTADDQRGHASNIAEERNRAVHDAWYVNAATGEPHQYRAMPKKDLVFGIHQHGAEKLTDFLAKLARHVEHVTKLSEAIQAARSITR